MHPAHKEVDEHRRRRHAKLAKGGAAVEGKKPRGRLDREPTSRSPGAGEGQAVDASSWRPPGPGPDRDNAILAGPLKLDKREGYLPQNYARGGGIHIKPSHRGLLHKNLGVPAGEKIPEAKLEKAKEHASPAEKKRIVFAEDAKKWHHG